MIKDKLLTELKSHFPTKEFRTGTSPDPIIVSPAKHPGVGQLSIWEDEGEVIVSIGDITHGHFDCFDTNLNQDEIESEIVEQIVYFLEDLFADKYLLYKSGKSGGWHHLDHIDKPFKSRDNTEYFIWSGLYDVSNLK